MTTIFTTHNVDHFFQQHPEKTHPYPTSLFLNTCDSLINNAKTQCLLIQEKEHLLFATLNNKEYGNTHLCSPYNVYIGHAKLAIKNFEKKSIRAFIYSFTILFGRLFKLLRLNKVIQLNNTLSTISLHPQNISPALPSIISTLVKQYPRHAILWPRLNRMLDAKLYDSLTANNFNFIPTKMVHIYHENYMKRSHTKRDLSLLKKSAYSIVPHEELTENDIIRIHDLYDMLFVKKHVSYNPVLTLQYFQRSHKERWFIFTGLRNSKGIIDAFISYAKKDNVMICGPLGYDIHKPIKLGLYRMIVGVALKQAHDANCLYNFGSGNEQFKLNRGSIREMEYNAVYYHHLPWYRQIPWKILAWAGEVFSRKLFKKHLL